jgi:beta-glucosidase
MATRILASWFRTSQLQSPGDGIPADLDAPHTLVNARDPASKSTIFQAAVEGHVLVKNSGSLPLKAPPFLSIFGYDAMAPKHVDYDVVDGFGLWSNGFDSLANLTDADIFDFFFANNSTSGPPSARAGTLISGGGSGSNTPPYVSAPFDAISEQAYKDDTYLMWDFKSQSPAVEGASSACLVFINEFASEGFDRPTLADRWSDQLVLNVARQCKNTIVSIHNAGVRLVDAWINNPNITAVIYSHLPGQDSGRSLVELLYGKQSFSGRLPYTVAMKASDYGTLLDPTVPDNESDYYTQSNFTEGVYIDYKSFIARNITPRFEFGFGLTYSSFAYSNLQVRLTTNASLTAIPPNDTLQVGGLASLYKTIAVVSATVTNTGNVTAAEVVSHPTWSYDLAEADTSLVPAVCRHPRRSAQAASRLQQRPSRAECKLHCHFPADAARSEHLGYD